MSRDILLEMLTYRRPAGSKTDRAFRREYLENLPGAYVDPHANIHIAIDESRTLWSSHTDTVHRHGGRQTLTIKRGQVGTADRQSNCLGADDTVGVYLMREMILAGRPGYYVFHHAEERGGIGSSGLARTHAEYLRENFDRAIALDRQGTGDIVTHQAGGRTCSDVFAWDLAEMIERADRGLVYAPTHGVYTDTAEYAGHIPECSNLSVGYRGQHWAGESVDLRHVDRLLGVLLTIDADALTIARDPALADADDPYARAIGDIDWGTDEHGRDLLYRDVPPIHARMDVDEDNDDPKELTIHDPAWWRAYNKINRRYEQ